MRATAVAVATTLLVGLTAATTPAEAATRSTTRDPAGDVYVNPGRTAPRVPLDVRKVTVAKVGTGRKAALKVVVTANDVRGRRPGLLETWSLNMSVNGADGITVIIQDERDGSLSDLEGDPVPGRLVSRPARNTATFTVPLRALPGVRTAVVVATGYLELRDGSDYVTADSGRRGPAVRLR